MLSCGGISKSWDYYCLKSKGDGKVELVSGFSMLFKFIIRTCPGKKSLGYMWQVFAFDISLETDREERPGQSDSLCILQDVSEKSVSCV